MKEPMVTVTGGNDSERQQQTIVVTKKQDHLDRVGSVPLQAPAFIHGGSMTNYNFTPAIAPTPCHVRAEYFRSATPARVNVTHKLSNSEEQSEYRRKLDGSFGSFVPQQTPRAPLSAFGDQCSGWQSVRTSRPMALDVRSIASNTCPLQSERSRMRVWSTNLPPATFVDAPSNRSEVIRRSRPSGEMAQLPIPASPPTPPAAKTFVNRRSSNSVPAIARRLVDSIHHRRGSPESVDLGGQPVQLRNVEQTAGQDLARRLQERQPLLRQSADVHASSGEKRIRPLAIPLAPAPLASRECVRPCIRGQEAAYRAACSPPCMFVRPLMQAQCQSPGSNLSSQWGSEQRVLSPPWMVQGAPPQPPVHGESRGAVDPRKGVPCVATVSTPQRPGGTAFNPQCSLVYIPVEEGLEGPSRLDLQEKFIGRPSEVPLANQIIQRSLTMRPEDARVVQGARVTGQRVPVVSHNRNNVSTYVRPHTLPCGNNGFVQNDRCQPYDWKTAPVDGSADCIPAADVPQLPAMTPREQRVVHSPGDSIQREVNSSTTQRRRFGHGPSKFGWRQEDAEIDGFQEDNDFRDSWQGLSSVHPQTPHGNRLADEVDSTTPRKTAKLEISHAGVSLPQDTSSLPQDTSPLSQDTSPLPQDTSPPDPAGPTWSEDEDEPALPLLLLSASGDSTPEAASENEDPDDSAPTSDASHCAVSESDSVSSLDTPLGVQMAPMSSCEALGRDQRTVSHASSLEETDSHTVSIGRRNRRLWCSEDTSADRSLSTFTYGVAEFFCFPIDQLSNSTWKLLECPSRSLVVEREAECLAVDKLGWDRVLEDNSPTPLAVRSTSSSRRRFRYVASVAPVLSSLTICQKSDTRPSDFEDPEGQRVPLQKHLLTMVASGSQARDCFGYYYGVASVSYLNDPLLLHRLAESRRIHALMRRVAETVEAAFDDENPSIPSPNATSCPEDGASSANAPSRNSSTLYRRRAALFNRVFDEITGSTSDRSAAVSPDVLFLEFTKRGLWPPELASDDIRDLLQVFSLSATEDQYLMVVTMEPPQSISRRGFVLALLSVPFILPDFPLTTVDLPDSSLKTRDSVQACRWTFFGRTFRCALALRYILLGVESASSSLGTVYLQTEQSRGTVAAGRTARRPTGTLSESLLLRDPRFTAQDIFLSNLITLEGIQAFLLTTDGQQLLSGRELSSCIEEDQNEECDKTQCSTHCSLVNKDDAFLALAAQCGVHQKFEWETCACLWAIEVVFAAVLFVVGVTAHSLGSSPSEWFLLRNPLDSLVQGVATPQSCAKRFVERLSQGIANSLGEGANRTPTSVSQDGTEACRPHVCVLAAMIEQLCRSPQALRGLHRVIVTSSGKLPGHATDTDQPSDLLTTFGLRLNSWCLCGMETTRGVSASVEDVIRIAQEGQTPKNAENGNGFVQIMDTMPRLLEVGLAVKYCQFHFCLLTFSEVVRLLSA